ncbi:hypothetical protein BEWA_006820 [Theileria equi strain WA]|uniref:Uncharacterized protein n=1 Tax=Theileria equi strain WA TaxID=1537102 RepID=L0B186_THEEQ|nr:hypothetical protein BEWA_006820 [Theileria equi strain WA]AFZ81273.1 hypothetical protein BEWA_006820 [Theileria equi strain WA]|eukprot:XP_004830939.1 hypothetical protein BEWA_006820 [Theileria equi strain WA]
MNIRNSVQLFRGWRNKSTFTEKNRGVKISKFSENANKDHKFDCYFELEDDYKRLARNCKVPYYMFGILTVMPTSISLITPPSPSYPKLLADQLKMSSLTLSWMAATHIGFQLAGFGKRTLLSKSRGIIGLFFATVGAAGTLIGADYSLTKGFYGLIVCYTLMGSYNAILSSRRLLPKSILKPSNNLVLLNLVLAAISLKRTYSIGSDIKHSSYEDIVKRFEAEHT